VLSQPEVYSRLAARFIGLRFDWEQGNHYKNKFGFILGTGDQMFLTPTGEAIAHDRPPREGRPNVVYGRHGCDTTPELLDQLSARNPPQRDVLKLEWFLWPQKPTQRAGGTYPVPHTAIAGYARLPYIIVDGPIPAALQESKFLRWHVREFVWVRGRTNGLSELSVRRVKDGLRPGLSTELATLLPGELTRAQLGQSLDRAWLEYMKHRPNTARGYLDNQYGSWMRPVARQMLEEEEVISQRASAGTLLPPGRQLGEPVPYR
jgi:hypothetical protein